MDNYSSSINFKNILKGVLISLISTLILLLVYSIILTYTSIGENTIGPVVIIITAISILIGSSIGSFKINKKGILNGALIGGIYFFIVYLISSLINMQFSMNFMSIILISVGIIFGILGGIIGVNKK